MKGFKLITDNGICEHSNGKTLVKCNYGSHASSLEECQSACESFDLCVGFYLKENRKYCQLLPSSPPSVCPNGNRPDSGAAAQTSDELVERPSDGWACYGKIGMLRTEIKINVTQQIDSHSISITQELTNLPSFVKCLVR